MILSSIRGKAGIYAFALAASITPIAIFIPASCGTGCGCCPLAGGCLAVPAVAVGIGAFSARFRLGAGLAWVRGGIGRVWGRTS